MLKCKECYFNSDGVCDMCSYGGDKIINNHGVKISEVKECQVELKIEDMPKSTHKPKSWKKDKRCKSGMRYA